MKQMTEEQRRHFHKRMDLILNDMRIPADAYQEFYTGENTFEFDNRFRTLIQEFILDSTNPFADQKEQRNEECKYSTCDIPLTSEQLANVHIKLGFQGSFETKVVEYPKSERADGVIIIPFLRDLGTAFGIPDPTGDGYGKVGESIWEKITIARESEISSKYIRLNTAVRDQIEALEAKISVKEGVIHYHALPVNSGSHFAGYSALGVRFSALQSSFLPLGFVQVLCILLAWPKRLNFPWVRMIDCPADEYDWEANSDWGYCPFIKFRRDGLLLSAAPDFSADGDYGSAVAFPGVPEESELGSST